MNGGDPWVRMDGWPVELQLSSEKRFARVLRQLCILFLGEHVVLDMRFFLNMVFIHTVAIDSR